MLGLPYKMITLSQQTSHQLDLGPQKVASQSRFCRTCCRQWSMVVIHPRFGLNCHRESSELSQGQRNARSKPPPFPQRCLVPGTMRSPSESLTNRLFRNETSAITFQFIVAHIELRCHCWQKRCSPKLGAPCE